MRLLANPLIARMVLAFVVAASALILGVWLMRRLRKEMAADIGEPTPRAEREPAFAVATFQSVIRELKQKQEDLERLRQAALEHASVAENIAAAVLTNIDTGVVVFNAAGLAQQANPAAREILGYAMIAGMHARDLFRGAANLRTASGDDAPADMAEAVERVVRDAAHFRNLAADYASPAGRKQRVAITVAQVLGPGGACAGAVCLLIPIFHEPAEPMPETGVDEDSQEGHAPLRRLP